MTTRTIQAPTTLSSSLLRHALRGNSAFSLAGGIMFIGAAPAAPVFGAIPPVAFITIGVLLLGYGAALFLVWRQATIGRVEGLTAVSLDALWVIGSAVVLVTGWPSLTAAGWWAVIILADIVALFAVLQFIGVRWLR